MKNFLKISVIVTLLFIYCYIASITLSDNKIQIKIFNKSVVKEVNVNVNEAKEVIPLGNSIALKIYTKGVLVVGNTEVKGIDNKKHKPSTSTNIKEGDIITQIDGENIANTDDLIMQVNKSNGREIEIKYFNNETEKIEKITPVQVSEKEYKLGLWVRDAAAGVGTATFYEPKTSSFAALGHGISDIDTEKIIDISDGELIPTKVVYIKRGEKGTPGEMKGTIDSPNKIGVITKNTNFGIYGRVTDANNIDIFNNKKIKVATRDEVQIGDAEILLQLNSKNVNRYKIKIKKIYKNNNKDNKSMQIEITDQNLLEKTGGIIQGMSGSPILQNEKFIGAITNVFVNDPTKGYAVFADLMLKNLD